MSWDSWGRRTGLESYNGIGYVVRVWNAKDTAQTHCRRYPRVRAHVSEPYNKDYPVLIREITFTFRLSQYVRSQYTNVPDGQTHRRTDEAYDSISRYAHTCFAQWEGLAHWTKCEQTTNKMRTLHRGYNFGCSLESCSLRQIAIRPSKCSLTTNCGSYCLAELWHDMNVRLHIFCFRYKCTRRYKRAEKCRHCPGHLLQYPRLHCLARQPHQV